MKKLILTLLLAIGVLAGPATSLLNGKSYSGGGSSSSSSPGRSSSTPTTPSRSTPAPTPYRPSVPASKPPSPSPAPPQRANSAGSSDRGTTGSNSSDTSAKPKSSYDSGAARAANKDGSGDAYRSYQQQKVKVAEEPKSSYVTPAGVAKPINKSDPEVSYLRGRLDGERYSNRETRRATFYSSAPQNTVVIHHYDDYYTRHYSDPYDNSFIYHWLVLQSLETQSQWVYSHRASLDQARLNELYAQNAALQIQVDGMQNRRVAVNSTYVPPGVDPDLMYTDAYVSSVANVTPVNDTVVVHTHGRTSVWTVIWSLVGLLVLAMMLWIIFALVTDGFRRL